MIETILGILFVLLLIAKLLDFLGCSTCSA